MVVSPFLTFAITDAAQSVKRAWTTWWILVIGFGLGLGLLLALEGLTHSFHAKVAALSTQPKDSALWFLNHTFTPDAAASLIQQMTDPIATVFRYEVSDTPVYALNEAGFSLLALHIAEGVPLTDTLREDVCIVGTKLAPHVLPSTDFLPFIPVGPHVCRVVGVLAPWEGHPLLYVDFNSAILVPLKTLQAWQSGMLEQIIMRTPLSQSALKAIWEPFAATRGAEVVIRDLSTVYAEEQKTLAMFTPIIAAMGYLSLGVAMIGLLGQWWIMMAKRKKEYALRLHLGAYYLQLVLPMAIEVTLVVSVGWILGVILVMILEIALQQFLAIEAALYVPLGYACSITLFLWVINLIMVAARLFSYMPQGTTSLVRRI